MADVGNRNPAARRKQSRLQTRAPASLQISPVTEWNVAIPLLSPLVQSPTSDINSTVEIKPSCNKDPSSAAEKPVVVMKKWQHPAAPFCYEPAPCRPFVRNR
ncbi:Uncharacterized protein - chloroplastic [Striga hermonthica]|uniref:Uncharacterized protein - chloroplastic n=2 Tax=Striga TaxID=4169 RepID=A0A9N7R7S9_STRHE|nr:3-isopropylmalate dehydratase large subunit [Striga asiatica]CAA0817447.1 Uncharacterized protein - chloroplastic [Striga hermonthica]